MKKQFLFITAFAIILSFLYSCSESYPDEWGFVAEYSGTKITISEAGQTGYNLSITNEVQVIIEGVGITKAGFMVAKKTGSLSNKSDAESIPATFERVGENIIIEAVLTNCSYDETYVITPFIGTDDFTYYGSQATIHRDKESMRPQVSNMKSSLEMVENAHTITPTVETEELIDDMTFTLGNVTKKASRQGNKFSANFDLYELEVGSYSVISFVATNSFGSVNGDIKYEVFVSAYNSDSRYTIRNANDGPHDDYITIGGTNWAKWNLVYNKGKWQLDKNAAVDQTNTSQTEDYIQFFSFGSTSGSFSEYISSEAIASMPENISGNKSYDIATVRLGSGWRLPTEEEGYYLMYSTSQQNTQEGLVVSPIQTRDKLFYSKTPVNMKKIPYDGLYFSVGGYLSCLIYYNYHNINFEDYGFYMTGQRHSRGYTSAKDHICCLYIEKNPEYSQYMLHNGDFFSQKSNSYYIYYSILGGDRKYRVRPVYAPKENH